MLPDYHPTSPFIYEYSTIYGTLPKSKEFNQEYSSMIRKGWEIDGPTSYVATPPTGKIVCIQRFKKRAEVKFSHNITTTHG